MAEHWCDTHRTKFFKTAKMQGYAHPIKDAEEKTISWCNEDAKEVAKLEPQSKPVVPLQLGEELPETIEMTKQDWATKDRNTRKSIERQKSLDCAVNWCIAKHSTEPIKTEMVITVASLFESYLENGITVKKKVD